MAELIEMTRVDLYQRETKNISIEGSDEAQGSGEDVWVPYYWLVFLTFGPPAGENMGKIAIYAATILGSFFHEITAE